MRATNLKYFFLFILMSFSLHKIYISITEIKENKTNNTLEIGSRLFINDLNDALQQAYHKDFELGTNRELPETDAKLKNYFFNHFQVKINGIWVPTKFIGKDFDGYDVVYCYFEVENVAKINSISVKNTTIMEIYPEQENTIQLDINDTKNSMLLNKSKQTATVNY